MQPQNPAVRRPIEKLVAALDDALGMLEAFSGAGEKLPAVGQNPVSLLDQCLVLCAQKQALAPEPVRTVHHFAATGGTLICKCLAAMPNTQVLSEVDPLSTEKLDPVKPRFAPTDMIQLMRQSTRGASPDLLVKLFLGNLAIIRAESIRLGQRLVVRDHAHSHYCTGPGIPDRPGLRSIIASEFPVLSVVTVRHPLDSFLSAVTNGWFQSSPATLDDYCRRYLAFLSAHEGIPVIRYEDFVDDPRNVMRRMCGLLDLPFSEQFTELFSAIKMTGDSGRSGDVIESRPRRPVDAPLAEEWNGSTNCRRLRAVLGYGE